MVRASAVLGCLALFAVGCGSSPEEPGTTNPTLVAVAPADFKGEVPCADAPGAMRRYVVTLFDLGSAEEPTAPYALPSGVVRGGDGIFRPTACEQVAAFGFVIPGHRYDAEVEAYDRTDLHAVGPGSRNLMDDATGEYVAPRWTTTCGRKLSGSPAEGPVTAAWYLTRYVRGCAPLSSTSGETPTGIRIEIDAALGALECGSAAGEVATFAVVQQGSTEAPKSAACGEAVELTGLEPGTSYTFDVGAFETGGSAPRWSTTCYRTAEKGAIVGAACDPLVEITPPG